MYYNNTFKYKTLIYENIPRMIAINHKGKMVLFLYPIPKLRNMSFLNKNEGFVKYNK